MKYFLLLASLLFSFASFANTIHCQGQQKDIEVLVNLSQEHIILASFTYRLGDETLMASFIQTSLIEDRETKTQSFRHDFRTSSNNNLFKNNTALSFRIEQKRESRELLSFELNKDHKAQLFEITGTEENLIDTFQCN